jgi:hypothetical protein
MDEDPTRNSATTTTARPRSGRTEPVLPTHGLRLPPKAAAAAQKTY